MYHDISGAPARQTFLPNSWLGSTKPGALLLALCLGISACAVPFGGSDDASGAIDATESSVAAQTDDGPAQATDVEDDTTQPDSTTAAAPAAGEDTIGRTGPIRELAFFAPWADTDLKPFLVEVMLFPEAVTIPGQSVLTYASYSQTFRSVQGEASTSFNADFLPTFDRDEFKTVFAQSLDPAVWALSEQEEDIENNATRITFTAVDAAAEHDRVTYTYTDGDTSKQPEIELWLNGAWVAGRTEITTNAVLWPWVNDITADPTMTDRSVTISLGWFDNEVSLDRRWHGPIGSFEASTAYFQNNTSADLVIGATEFSDSVWPSNDIDVTRAVDGFSGEFSVSETDPEDEVSISLIGRYPLE